MIIAFIAGGWAVLMVLVLALCRAAALADAAIDPLSGDRRTRPSARRLRPTYADRARRPSLVQRGLAMRDPWFTSS